LASGGFSLIGTSEKPALCGFFVAVF